MIPLGLFFFPILLSYYSIPIRSHPLKKIFVIPHSHNDVGWLKTVDDYFKGKHEEIQSADVRKILYSVLSDLSRKNNHTFIYSEMEFFSRWYTSLDYISKLSVKKLLLDGKLELINGGWVMNDEASCDYTDIIHQMSYGRRFILETFGPEYLPKTGWQIDTFGHSQTMAAIYHAMGYDSLFIGRVPQDLLLKLRATERTEFEWVIQEPMNSKTNRLWTSILPNVYSPPNRFCFDSSCADDEIIDNPDMPNFNLHTKAYELAHQLREYSNFYPSPNVVLTAGNDFNYQIASKWFSNMDLLVNWMKHQSNETKFDIEYSTPSRYAKEAKRGNNHETFLYTGDFLPYNDKPSEYWTGFYSSRIAFKAFVRETSWLNFVLLQLQMFYPSISEPLEQMKRVLSIVQHHDAVTGTSRQRVINDYVRMLSEVRFDILEVTLPSDTVDRYGLLRELFYCPYLNISFCPRLNHQSEYFAYIYNPNERSDKFCVRTPVESEMSGVYFLNGTKIPSEVISVDNKSYEVDYFKHHSKFNIYFCTLMEATRFTVVQIKPFPKEDLSSKLNSDRSFKRDFDEFLMIDTKYYQIYLDRTRLLLKKVVTKIVTAGEYQVHSKQSFNVTLGYYIYTSGFHSGAYIFRPIEERPSQSNLPKPCGDAQHIKSEILKSDSTIVTEIRTQYGDFCFQTLRIWKDSPIIDVEYTVGPVALDSLDRGKEMIFRIDTDLSTNGIFYTDNNGREFMKRTYKKSADSTYSSNYYPITRRAALREFASGVKEIDQRQIVMLTDRSVGVTSYTNGALEAMLLRRIRQDDARGLNEYLDENDQFLGKDIGAKVRGKFSLSFGTAKFALKLAYEKSRRLQNPPFMLFGDHRGIPRSDGGLIGHKVPDDRILASDLPQQIRMLSFEIMDTTVDKEGITAKMSVLVRFEHIYYNVDKAFTSPKNVEIVLSRIFDLSYSSFGKFTKLDCAHEMYLAGDIPLTNSVHLSADKQSSDCVKSINISPGQIRTLILQFSGSAKTD